jgi:hypothetical protein
MVRSHAFKQRRGVLHVRASNLTEECWRQYEAVQADNIMKDCRD